MSLHAAHAVPLRRGRHMPAAGGAWLPAHAPREVVGAPALDPVSVVTAELEAFLRAVETRTPQGPGLVEGGVAPLSILDAARRSAQEGRVVAVGEE